MVPLGHCGSQPSAGHGVGAGGGGMGGGTQPGSLPPQSQVQGGQAIVVGSQPGQAQAQPVPPVPPPLGGGGGDWHTPDGQVPPDGQGAP